MTCNYTVDVVALKKIMFEKGVKTYFDLAKRANINRNTVSDLANGKTRPNMSIMYAIAEVLQLTPGEAGQIFFAKNITDK